ncbi:MAG: DUF1152 domain-containing protein [Candidatus Hadarchaeales archaeon]
MCMKFLKSAASNAKKAMVVGIGGGGDVVGAIPTSNYLREIGLSTVLGGLTWERYVNDPEPGPRRMDEILNIKKLARTAGLASSETRTNKGVRFTEAMVAEALCEETLLVDPNLGVKGIVDGLNTVVDLMGFDLFVGIDVGGDVLAAGNEEGLRSMLADSMMLAAMVNLKIPAVLGVLGCCTDGELTFDQFLKRLSLTAEFGGLLGARGLTPEDLKVLESVIPRTKTESTALAVKAAKGTYGDVKIRGGCRTAQLTPVAAVTFYLDPVVVFERVNGIAKMLAETSSIEEANEIVVKAGLPSELEFQRSGGWKKYVNGGAVT